MSATGFHNRPIHRSACSLDLSSHLPEGLPSLEDHQRVLPAIAKNAQLMGLIEDAVQHLPTNHQFFRADARAMDLAPESVHLVVTSPPYWTLKEYRKSEGQLGHIQDYEAFLVELDQVWQRCHEALVPGGRLICVVGDVCLSRRRNNGRHTVVPLHASIQEHCRRMGFDNLAPIIWSKIANASYEVEGNGSSFLGKPYEPNAIIKNDIEFILMQRKPGGYRSPSVAARVLSLISDANHKEWFQQIWTGIAGASTRRHPAPFPLQLAERLIRMFSFAGDTVLDPFVGSGTTMLAAIQSGRNSISYEVDGNYAALCRKRIRDSLGMFSAARVCFHDEA
jgi:DNA modification methylase